MSIATLSSTQLDMFIVVDYGGDKMRALIIQSISKILKVWIARIL